MRGLAVAILAAAAGSMVTHGAEAFGPSPQASVLPGLPFDGASPFGANLLAPTPGERIATRAYARLPLSFEPNRGQTDPRARFLARGHGYTLFLTDSGALMSLERGKHKRPALLRMGFAGASSRPRIKGGHKLAGRVNYLVGGTRSRRRTNIPTYATVRYRDLYPGVDLLYYGRGGRLEYDFRLAPGADPAQIVLRFRGAQVRLAGNGDLLLRAGGESVRQLRPVAYQRFAGRRRAVESGYELLGGGRVGLRLGRYDRARRLVIDPVLLYSTYLGGSASDGAEDIAVDGAVSAYVTGETRSTNFPVRNPIDGTFGSPNPDVFVTKFDPSGGGLVYSTYLGGGGAETGRGIAVDGSGNAYVTGNTSSGTFPVEAPQQAMLGGPNDAFVTKLDPSGSALVYSTFLGGSGNEFAFGIAVDGSGNAYVTGNTTSSANFPIQAPQQSLYGGGGADAFVTKFNPSGSAHVYSTYLGGSDFEAGTDIAVDVTGSAYIVGETRSTNFPPEDPQQPMKGGLSDAFVTQFNASGSAHLYSTYLGGSLDEYGIGIAVDEAGNAHVTGFTESANFPLQNPLQPTPGAGGDGFVTKFNASGSAHLYSTYLGGSDGDQGNKIAVDGAGNAWVTGPTSSTNFPVQGPSQPTNGGMSDAFVTQLNSSGSALVYSTYLGGSGNDRGVGIALGGAGAAYVAGNTESANFPMQGPFQADFGGDRDAFVIKIGEPPPADGEPPPPAGGEPRAPADGDTTAPGLSSLRLVPTVFPAAGTGGSVAQRRRTGTRVSYALSEPATVTFRVQRAALGRRVRGTCRRPRRDNRSRPRCLRYVVVRGSFQHVGAAGANRLRFTGRLRGRKLRPGRYRLGARAVDAAGNASRVARRKFRVVRR
jgi:Beta-propeller repeat